jgi:hypothetical protein
MRFMMMHKNDPHTEAGELPPKELVEKMGEFIGGHARTGRLIDGAGLSRSSTRTRLTFRGGACTVKHGPYRGEHELPAAMLLLKVKTREEAIGWAERYGKILGTGELELGKVNEPWDIGLMPAPENPPLQILLIEKADQASEAGTRGRQQKAELTRLRSEMTKAGVLVRETQLQPSARAKRLMFSNNDLKIFDGPFSESKELIGGFAVLELSGLDEAIALSRTYAAILGGTLEMDIRPLAEPEAA